MINFIDINITLEEHKNLVNKINNHLIKIEKYQGLNDNLYNKIKEITKDNRYYIWFSILIYIFCFLCLYYLKHYLVLNKLIKILLNIILNLFSHINCYYQMKNYLHNNKKLEKLENDFQIVSQDLFAEKFFLIQTKKKYETNKYKLFILRKELGLKNNYIYTYNINDKGKILSKKNNLHL